MDAVQATHIFAWIIGIISVCGVVGVTAALISMARSGYNDK